MRPVVTLFVSAVLALTLQPAVAQSPGASTMPPGTQNPALVQPRLVQPPGGPLPQSAPQPGAYQPGPQPSGYQPGPQPSAAQPGGFQPGPTPNNPAPSALIGPDGAGGLCECLINHDPNVPAFDKTKMHQSCLGSPEACQATCQTDHYYSFVPHAIYTCPGPNGPMTGHIALNMRSAVRLLSRR